MAAQTTAKPLDADRVGATSNTTMGYARVVDEVRDGGLTINEIAGVIGVAEKQVRNWTGGARPAGKNRDRLLELHYIVTQLREVYTAEGAEIWIHGPKRSFGAKRPIDLLEAGRWDEILDAIERLNAGAI